MKKKIILFYKVLEAPGGAERLLLHEYKEFKRMGHDVSIVTFAFNSEAFFSEQVDENDLLVLGQGILAILKLRAVLKKNQEAIVLGSSGHLDLYLATLFSNLSYSLHIHHPSFMSFNEYDKYSLFQRTKFDDMLHSNFGAVRFAKIRDSLSLWQKVKINLRAAVSIAGIRKADNIFVLSEYAKKEKKDLFNVDSHVVCGAISQQDIGLVPEIKIIKYKDYEQVVLTIARLDINKRIDVLIKSFALLLEKMPNAMLVIGGNGPEKESLKSLTKQLGIEGNVDFVGFIPDEELYSYYAAADLFASIDWADYRITTYESLAVGTKVLLSNETDFGKDLVDSGYLRFTKPNVEETAGAIKAMLDSKPLRDIAWLNRYLEQVTWPTFCRKLMDYLT